MYYEKAFVFVFGSHSEFTKSHRIESDTGTFVVLLLTFLMAGGKFKFDA